MTALPAPTLSNGDAVELLRRYLTASQRTDSEQSALDFHVNRLLIRLNVGEHASAASAEELAAMRPHLEAIATGPPLYGPELVEAFAKARKATLEPQGVTGYSLEDLGLVTASASATVSTVPALWGTVERMLATDGGRYLMLFGNDGAGKTTTALRLAAGALGVDGFETLLGEPVAPMAEGLGVLFLSVDGPEEARANLGRMRTADGQPLADAIGPLYLLPTVPPTVATQERGLVDLVEAVEAETRQPFGLVVVDNAMRTYGNVTEPNLGNLAARSIGHVTSSGRSLILITQTVKGTEAARLENAYAGADMTSACGTAVSLYHTKSQPGGSGRLRHIKGYGSDPTKLSHYWTEAENGAVTLGDPPKGSPERAEHDRATLAEGLAEAGGWLSVADVAERLDLNRRTAARGLKALEGYGLAESRTREGQGGGIEYRGTT